MMRERQIHEIKTAIAINFPVKISQIKQPVKTK